MKLEFAMLWWVGSKIGEEDIQAAIDYYRQKYPSNTPAVVYMNPAQIGDFRNVGGLPVRPDRTVVKDNLYISVA